MSRTVHLESNALVVLCGISGSGKSTFAARFFLNTQIVATDRIRGLLSDDESNIHINEHTFEVFHLLIQKRLTLGCLTVADSTALWDIARQTLLNLANAAKVKTCLIIFSLPLEDCLARVARRIRKVPLEVAAQQYADLQTALQLIESEGWDQIVVISDIEEQVSFVVE
jgi:protein phosphatase